MHFYRPQRSYGKVMFLHVSVILFTLGSGRQTPPGRHPSRSDIPPSFHPGTATAADGTHLTGMHSCKKCGWLHASLVSREVANSPAHFFHSIQFSSKNGKILVVATHQPLSFSLRNPGSVSRSGSRIPCRRERQHTILPNFAKKLHEIEKMLGCRGDPPPPSTPPHPRLWIWQ